MFSCRTESDDHKTEPLHKRPEARLGVYKRRAYLLAGHRCASSFAGGVVVRIGSDRSGAQSDAKCFRREELVTDARWRWSGTVFANTVSERRNLPSPLPPHSIPCHRFIPSALLLILFIFYWFYWEFRMPYYLAHFSQWASGVSSELLEQYR